MGSPVSPIVANLFMEAFEATALTTTSSKPRFWARYVDDTLAIIKTSDIDKFTDHLNNLNPAIQFTRELEKNGTIAMLDTQIHKLPNGRLKFTIFRKATHTDHYLQFDSHQPLEHKLGVIRTLSHRAHNNITTEEDKMIEKEHLKKVLSISKYKKWAWDISGSKKKIPHPRRTIQTKALGHVTIPYVQGITEAISRKLRKAGVSAHARPINTIRNNLVSPKDKINPLNRCGVVYQISCEDCNATYVGETERELQKRISEHRKETSPEGAHMINHQHTFNLHSKKVLDQESRWFECGVREAIHIRTTSPQLNRDQGHHHLPAVYNTILALDNSTTPTSCDNSNHC